VVAGVSFSTCSGGGTWSCGQRDALACWRLQDRASAVAVSWWWWRLVRRMFHKESSQRTSWPFVLACCWLREVAACVPIVVDCYVILVTYSLSA
jgi:hypothetical protein